MTEYSKNALYRNLHPDLFDWYRERELRSANPAAKKIATRFGLSVHHAMTIVTHAGIGSEVTQ